VQSVDKDIKKPRSLVRFIGKAVLFVALFGALSMATVYIVFWLMDRSETIAARKDGIAMDPVDLNRGVVAPQDNAAPLYRDAINRLSEVDAKGFSEGKALAFRVSRRPDPKGIEREKALLLPYQPALAIVELASTKPRCEFNRDLSQGNKFSTPEYDPLKHLTKFECIVAEMAAANGNDDQAVHHLQVAARLASDIGSDPTFEAEQASISAQGMVQRSLVGLINRGARNSAFLDGIQRFLDSLPAQKNLRFYAEGDLVLNRVIIHQLPSLSLPEVRELMASTGDDPEKEKVAKLIRSRILNPLFDADFVSLYRTFIKALPIDDSNWPAIRLAGIRADVTSSNSTIASLYTTMFARQLLALSSSAVKSLTRRRLTNVAVRILQLQTASGALPEAMPDYGLLSIDPFTGKRFQYQKLATGFRVFSVGPDGKSNGISNSQDLVLNVTAAHAS